MYLIVWVAALHAVGAAVWSGCRALHGQGGAGWEGSGDSQRMRRSGWDLGLALGAGFALSPPWLPAEEGGGVRRRGAWGAGVVPNPSYSGALYFHSSSALCYCSVTSLSPTPHLLATWHDLLCLWVTWCPPLAVPAPTMSLLDVADEQTSELEAKICILNSHVWFFP